MRLQCFDDILASMGIATLNPMQHRVIKSLMQGDNLLLGASTGSGKSVAFLLPFLVRYCNDTPIRHYPKGVILLPTKELTQQLFHVASKLAKPTSIRVASTLHRSSTSKILDRLSHSDLLVCTPDRLSALLQANNRILQGVGYIVIDEADLLMQNDFIEHVQTLFAHASKHAQVCFASATLTPQLHTYAKRLVKPLHVLRFDPPLKVPQHIKQYLYLATPARKKALLYHVIDTHRFQKALIFANNKQNIETVYRDLKQANIGAIMLHSTMDPKERMYAIKRFRDEKSIFLCTSDVAARGLDFADIDGVIHFDVARYKHDYIHRCGRCARGSRSGKSIMIASTHEIEEVLRLRSVLKPIQEVFLPDFAPKGRKTIFAPLNQKRNHTPKKRHDSTQKRRGKKRKTTKRDQR